MNLPFNNVLSGQQSGQGQPASGGYGANPFAPLFQNPQLGQWMGQTLNAFNSLLSNFQRQLGSGMNLQNQQGGGQENFMRPPGASPFQGSGNQAGILGQLFPSFIPRQGANNQMTTSQGSLPSVVGSSSAPNNNMSNKQ